MTKNKYEKNGILRVQVNTMLAHSYSCVVIYTTHFHFFTGAKEVIIN